MPAEEEENKALVRLLVEEGWNQANRDVIAATQAPTFIDHSAPPGFPSDQAGARQIAAMYLGAFPDLHLTLEDLIAEGDRVVARWSSRGTHRGEFMGLPPTGKVATSTGITILRVAGGKIIESWQNLDLLGLLQQLGAIPTRGQASNS